MRHVASGLWWVPMSQLELLATGAWNVEAQMVSADLQPQRTAGGLTESLRWRMDYSGLMDFNGF